MFAAVTIYTAISLYIENRDSPGTDELPLGYQHFTCFRVICVVTTIMFVLNNWLADAIMVSSMKKLVHKLSDLSFPFI